MTKVMIVSIDALDPNQLLKFKNSMPNLRKMMEESPAFKMKSVFPPDTIPAWITIYTGLNPAEHGIIHTFDIFESDWQSITNLSVDAFKGRTFWDIAGKNGKKVCVLFPQSAFPPWEVNGVMVSRSLYPPEYLKKNGMFIENNGVLAYPPSIANKYKINHLSTLSGDYPGFKDLGNYAEKAKRKVLDQAEFGLKISKDYDWDLFFIYFSELDIIQHFFWRYFDEKDPTHPPNNPYKNVIPDFYKLFDQIIGEFFKTHPDAVQIVMSDHGHGMRPPKTVNINEYLRERGYLKIANNPSLMLVEKIKRKLLDFVHKRDLTYWLVKLGKSKLFSGVSKKVYTSSSTIDTENSLAYLSYFTGAKSYSQGGINLNRAVLGEDYDKFREKLMRELYVLKDPTTNEELFEWIKRREELYQGKNINLYPDIVFKFKDEYGVYWSVYSPLTGTSYEHNLSSGGHKEDAVFLISGLNGDIIKENMTLMDVAPTVLDILGINKK